VTSSIKDNLNVLRCKDCYETLHTGLLWRSCRGLLQYIIGNRQHRVLKITRILATFNKNVDNGSIALQCEYVYQLTRFTINASPSGDTLACVRMNVGVFSATSFVLTRITRTKQNYNKWTQNIHHYSSTVQMQRSFKYVHKWFRIMQLFSIISPVLHLLTQEGMVLEMILNIPWQNRNI